MYNFRGRIPKKVITVALGASLLFGSVLAGKQTVLAENVQRTGLDLESDTNTSYHLLEPIRM